MSDQDEGRQVATAASEAHEALRAAVVRIRNACRMLGIEGAPVASGTAIALADLVGAIVADGDGTDAERMEALQAIQARIVASMAVHRRGR